MKIPSSTHLISLFLIFRVGLVLYFFINFASAENFLDDPRPASTTTQPSLKSLIYPPTTLQATVTGPSAASSNILIVSGTSTTYSLVILQPTATSSAGSGNSNYDPLKPWTNSSSFSDVGHIIDPFTNFCFVGLHSSTVMHNQLFIWGGYAGYIFQETRSFEPNTYLRAISLDQKFSVVKQFTEDSSPVGLINGVGITPVIRSSGILWHDNSSLYSFMGYKENGYARWGDPVLENTSDSFSYEFDTKQALWIFPNGAPPEQRSNGMGCYANKLGIGYYLGGFSLTAGLRATGSLFSSAFATSSDWRNETLKGAPWNPGGIGDGTLSYVSIGLNLNIKRGGYLIPLGGLNLVDDNFYSLSEITLLDPMPANTTVRKAQPATPADLSVGLPVGRVRHCSVVVASQDGSSYNIYIFGGRTDSDHAPRDTNQLDDVWVLSLPSFKWFRVHNGAFETVRAGYLPAGLAREGHTCDLVGKRYMMVYGGMSLSIGIDMLGNNVQCDSTGIMIFDLSTLEWLQGYDPTEAAKPYEVPKMIYQEIGGSPQGGATKLPEGGILDPEVSKVIEDVIKQVQTNSTKSTQGKAAKNPSSNPKRRIILAATLIPITVLFAILLCYFLFRRHINQKVNKQKDLEYYRHKPNEIASSDSVMRHEAEAVEKPQELAHVRQSFLRQEMDGSNESSKVYVPRHCTAYYYELPGVSLASTERGLMPARAEARGSTADAERPVQWNMI